MTATADALMAIFGFKRVEGKQMKSDRELLELAAKAAGYEVWQGRGHQADMLFMRLEKPDPTGKCSGREWNPLADDGDALRLATKLRISLRWCSTGRVYAYADGDVEEVESTREEPDSSVRRVIVRAAAEIGRTT